MRPLLVVSEERRPSHSPTRFRRWLRSSSTARTAHDDAGKHAADVGNVSLDADAVPFAEQTILQLAIALLPVVPLTMFSLEELLARLLTIVF